MEKRERTDKRGDWEKALSRRFQDFELPISELPPLSFPPKKHSHFKWRWVAIVTSVAATIIFVLFLIRENTQEPHILHGTFPPPGVIASNNEENKIVDSPSRQYPNIPIGIYRPRSESNHEMMTIVSEKTDHNNIWTEEKKEIIVQNDDIDTKGDSSDGSLLDSSSEKLLGNNLRFASQSKRYIRLSLFTSGLTLNTNTVTMSRVGDGIIKGQQDDYSVRETPMFEIGSTILYPISRRWSLQTGLKYSWYRIEIKDNSIGSKDDYILDVHSLGIPLDIQYTIYNAKTWRMYGQYGVGINIPFKSTITGSAVSEGGATISLDTSLAFGMEYNITHQIGLYTSLGVTYDLLQLQSNLPSAEISRWHGMVEAGIRFNINR